MNLTFGSSDITAIVWFIDAVNKLNEKVVVLDKSFLDFLKDTYINMDKLGKPASFKSRYKIDFDEKGFVVSISDKQDKFQKLRDRVKK